MVDERFPNWDIDVENGTIYSLKNKRYIGSVDKKYGYVKVNPPKGYKHCKLHQYIWICVNGDIPNGFDIHHIDGNKLNNSIYNLEIVEHKKHMSEHKIGNKCHQGKNHSEETKKKISEGNKGKIVSEDTKEKISKRLTNNPKTSKQVAQYTLYGELVKIWESASECGRNGFNYGCVSACCNGVLKKHKGYIWKYV